MKGHALILQAAFTVGETGYRNKENWFREEFEKNTVADRTVCRRNGRRNVHRIYGNGGIVDRKTYKKFD